MDNVDVARLLEEVADLLEIDGTNPFRVRAYRTAARTIETLGESVVAVVARDGAELSRLPGIGKDLAGKLVEVVTTGDLSLRRELVERTPASIIAMMRVAGLGPRRAKRFYEELGVGTIDELEAAARAGKLHAMRGVGPVLEQRILQGCAEQKARVGRYRLAEADAQAAPLLAYLRESPHVLSTDLAGSVRRRKETIGDLDVLVASKDPVAIAERFLGYPDVNQVRAHGETKCSVVLRSGVQVDLRVVAPECYGAALHYFTGSKAHNIAIRTLGMKRKLKISEYGVFRGERRVGGRTEEEVFGAVGLPWIPPELREDQGEIDAARDGRLPKLVELVDVQGDLHVHTDAGDGASSLREMLLACAARGYRYVAITDRVQAGLDRAGLRGQRREIEALGRDVPGLPVLHGAEVEIREDGSLDVDEDMLSELDVVVAAVHSGFSMSKEAMTSRVLRALAHPRVNILALPAGRLLGEREAYAIDMANVVAAVHEHGVLLEINAQPDRADLSDTFLRMARDAGTRFVIDTDAHRSSELDFMRYGVDRARRGWCSAQNVANTLPLPELRALLRREGPKAARRTHGREPRPREASRP